MNDALRDEKTQRKMSTHAKKEFTEGIDADIMVEIKKDVYPHFDGEIM
ncbi:MAG: hypothetical protein K6F16_00600 [Lachnospiraceae bacterium]|nr:hypothetical protein [Lachnospiraceae bacterium]